jgi:hypothetical protein
MTRAKDVSFGSTHLQTPYRISGAVRPSSIALGRSDLVGWYCLLKIEDANVSVVDLGKEKKGKS